MGHFTMENVRKWITSIPMEVTIMRRSYANQEKISKYGTKELKNH